MGPGESASGLDGLEPAGPTGPRAPLPSSCHHPIPHSLFPTQHPRPGPSPFSLLQVAPPASPIRSGIPNLTGLNTKTQTPNPCCEHFPHVVFHVKTPSPFLCSTLVESGHRVILRNHLEPSASHRKVGGTDTSPARAQARAWCPSCFRGAVRGRPSESRAGQGDSRQGMRAGALGRHTTWGPRQHHHDEQRQDPDHALPLGELFTRPLPHPSGLGQQLSGPGPPLSCRRVPCIGGRLVGRECPERGVRLVLGGTGGERGNPRPPRVTQGA